MELLLEQIRNKRAKELVAREINSHIEDQKKHTCQGLSAYDAERRAVLDMGDPVETEFTRDAPQTENIMAYGNFDNNYFALGILMLGIMQRTSDFTTTALLKASYLPDHRIRIMLFICKIDYSRFFQRSGILALIFYL